MTNLMQKVEEFFVEDDWVFDANPQQRVIRCGFKGTNGAYRLVVQVLEDDQQVIAYALCPNYVPEELRVAAGRYIHRANYGLKIGNFEFDETDGEVRYKSAIDVEGGLLTTTMVRNLVVPALLMMDRYNKGLMSLVYGGKSPEDAVALVEGPFEETDQRLFEV